MGIGIGIFAFTDMRLEIESRQGAFQHLIDFLGISDFNLNILVPRGSLPSCSM